MLPNNRGVNGHKAAENKQEYNQGPQKAGSSGKRTCDEISELCRNLLYRQDPVKGVADGEYHHHSAGRLCGIKEHLFEYLPSNLLIYEDSVMYNNVRNFVKA